MMAPLPEEAKGGQPDRTGSVLRFAYVAIGAIVVLLAVALRTVYLQSDAYPRLSWSSALLTDEGFYIHNARNLILFGKLRTDEFNNMLIMPLLHAVQVVVFRFAGVGTVQARAISVVAGIAMAVVFGDALRRTFGVRIAALGAMFLALDHVLVLYSRIAGMDTPAAFLIVLGFWCFACAAAHTERRNAWLSACGAVLIMAYATRTTAIVVLLGPLIAVRGDRRAVKALLSSAVLALSGFLILWWAPHSTELRRLNGYYLNHQLVPHSLGALMNNVQVATIGDARGFAAFLWRHNPVWLGACMLWFAAGRPSKPSEREVCDCLTWWLAPLVILFSLVNYSPSRYYILFYPAMAAISAIALVRAGEVLIAAWRNRLVVGVIAGFATFHLGRLAWSHPGITPYLSGAVGVAFVAWPRSQAERPTAFRAVKLAALCIWIAVDAGWTHDWLTHITYRQRSAGLWLKTNLPRGSVLLGAVAPGLCMDNDFKVVNVISSLCNDRDPVSQFPGSPRYVVILDDAWKEKYWLHRYPDIVATHRRIQAFHNILRQFFTVGVYAVPGEYRSHGSRSGT